MAFKMGWFLKKIRIGCSFKNRPLENNKQLVVNCIILKLLPECVLNNDLECAFSGFQEW
jgi:hypothetical protein